MVCASRRHRLCRYLFQNKKKRTCNEMNASRHRKRLIKLTLIVRLTEVRGKIRRSLLGGPPFGSLPVLVTHFIAAFCPKRLFTTLREPYSKKIKKFRTTSHHNTHCYCHHRYLKNFF